MPIEFVTASIAPAVKAALTLNDIDMSHYLEIQI